VCFFYRTIEQRELLLRFTTFRREESEKKSAGRRSMIEPETINDMMTSTTGTIIMPNVFLSLSVSRQKALAIIPKCLSIFSIMGSTYVIFTILRNHYLPWRQRTGGVIMLGFDNILLGLCTADLFISVALLLSTWPIPTDTIYRDYIWGERGTQITCDIQGFMIQLGGSSSVLYTCALSLHFLLSIRFGWLPLRIRKIEPFLHAVCIGIPFASAVLLLTQKLYNPRIFMCSTQSYPIGCDTGSTPASCLRGYNARWYALFLIEVPIIIGTVFIISSMIAIYLSVRELDRRMSRFRLASDAQEQYASSKRVFRRACQYVAAYCITWIPVMIGTVIHVTSGSEGSFGFSLAVIISMPLQGFINAIVYSSDLRERLGDVVRSIASRHGSTHENNIPNEANASILTNAAKSEEKTKVVDDNEITCSDTN